MRDSKFYNIFIILCCIVGIVAFAIFLNDYIKNDILPEPMYIIISFLMTIILFLNTILTCFIKIKK